MRADFKKNAIFKFTVKKNDRPFGDEKMITLICEDAEPIDL